jgi:hypothetical protein
MGIKMSAETNSKYSVECENRILSWLEALQKAYSNIKVKEYIESKPESTDNSCNFILTNRPHFADASYTAADALINYAIILTWHVFASGYEGEGIAKNTGDAEVDNFRKNMNDYVKAELNWSDKYFLEFTAIVGGNRNELVAHYDGNKANFVEVIKEVLTSKKMIGARISNNDIETLKTYIETMCHYIETNLYCD